MITLRRAEIETHSALCEETQRLKFGRLIDPDMIEKMSATSEVDEAR